MPKEPTKARVFRLALQGHAGSEIARRLRLSRATVHYHLDDLEGKGALSRRPGTRNPVFYQMGPRGAEFEKRFLRRKGADRGGRSTLELPNVPVRVHNRDAGYKWKVLAGPAEGREPEWGRTWPASGVMNKHLYRSIEGRRWRFWLIEGKGDRTLMIQPPEEYVYTPGALEAVKRERLIRVGRLAKEFAKAHGYVLQQEIVEAGDVEFGIEVPSDEVEREGVPGQDAVWVDTSPEGTARAEVETGDPSIARAMMSLPVTMEEIREQREALERRVLALQEKVNLNQRQAASAFEAVEELADVQSKLLDLLKQRVDRVENDPRDGMYQ